MNRRQHRVALSLAAAALTCSRASVRPARLARSPTPQMVDLLKVVDDRQKNNGDWRAQAYLEQKEKDKVDVVYETESSGAARIRSS